MRLSVCIPSVRSTTLHEAINSIRRQTWSNWELIVVGQGNDSAVRAITEAAATHDSRVQYLHVAVPGVSRARNAGLEAATGEVIAFMDDDCEARSDWLETIAKCFADEPDVGHVGGALMAPMVTPGKFASCPAVVPTESLYDPVATERTPPLGWDWVSANFAMRRFVAEQVGPFDEWLGPGLGAVFPSGEDTDYKLRLEALGIKMRSTPRAMVIHSYGSRYGLKAVLRQSRSYAIGNGGLAGKLTLLGDPRGREWVALTARECILDSLRRRRLHRVPHNLLRLWYYTRAYRRCLREFDVDAPRRLLRPHA
jgi:glycosyltransferase involved in cell wall biosynthesis